MHAPPPILIAQTDRLRLRRLTEEDAGFMLRLLNEPDFHRFIGDRRVRNAEQALDYLRRGILLSYAEFGFSMYLCERIDDGAAIGICGLVKRDYLPFADLGYALLPQYIGKGYATEACSAVLKHAGELRMEMLLAIVQTDNRPSIKLLEALGFVFQRSERLPPEMEELQIYALPLSDKESSRDLG